MNYRLDPDNPRHVLVVGDDSTEQPFAVVFDPTAGQTVVDALNASLAEQPARTISNVVNGPVNESVVQIGFVAGSVRA